MGVFGKPIKQRGNDIALLSRRHADSIGEAAIEQVEEKHLLAMQPIDRHITQWVAQCSNVLEWANEAAACNRLTVIDNPHVNGLKMRRIVGQVGAALNCAVGRVDVMAQVGRVYEVLAYPHLTTVRDPLFPITLAPLSRQYRIFLARYVDALGRLPRDDGWQGRNKARWYAQASVKMWDVVEQLASEAAAVLAWQELAFLLVVLDYARAAPLGATDQSRQGRWEANTRPGRVASWR